MENNRPVILVHGLLGFGPKELGPFEYWKNALKVPSPLLRHEASVGPLSSVHDRACELAAQIKGTQVDYGKEHAETEGHERLGRDYTGKAFVEDWSADQPVHMVGHGMGAATIRCLEDLLEKDYWGWSSDHTWISSVTSISGSLNGSTVIYLFGVDDDAGLIQGFVPSELMRLFEIFTAATGGLFESIYDLDLDHWNFTRLEGETLPDFITRVSDSKFLWGKDNGFYSMSLQGAYEANGEWKTYPDTHYFSYVTEQTYSGLLSGNYYPNLTMNPGLLVTATYIGRKEFARPPIAVANFDSEDWWENDGVIPTYSQKVPHTQGSHPLGEEFDEDTPIFDLEPGKWHHRFMHDVDHLDLTVWPQLFKTGMYKTFYRSLFEGLSEMKIKALAPVV